MGDLIPHVRLDAPIDRRGRFPVVDQDSADEITQAVVVIVATRPGERPASMQFGVNDHTFVGTDVGQLVEVVDLWDPRADIAVTADAVERVGSERVEVRVGR